MSEARPRADGALSRGLAVFCLVAIVLGVGIVRVVSAGEPAPQAHGAATPAGSPTPVFVASPGNQPGPTRSSGRGPPPRVGVVVRPADHWRHVLTRLSSIRALAWRRSEPGLLTRVYVTGAAELRVDQRMLQRYADRGLSVADAQLVFGPVRVTARSQRTARLLVVDQLGPAVAVTRGGARLRLPNDLPSRHRIALAKTARGWRIASVTAAAP